MLNWSRRKGLQPLNGSCLNDESMVLQQHDANHLAQPCSFSSHPECKLCCFGDAAFAKWIYPHLLHISKKANTLEVPMCSKIKKFLLNIDADTDRASSIQVKRQLLSEISTVTFTYVMFTFRHRQANICRCSGFTLSFWVHAPRSHCLWAWLSLCCPENENKR